MRECAALCSPCPRNDDGTTMSIYKYNSCTYILLGSVRASSSSQQYFCRYAACDALSPSSPRDTGYRCAVSLSLSLSLRVGMNARGCKKMKNTSSYAAIVHWLHAAQVNASEVVCKWVMRAANKRCIVQAGAANMAMAHDGAHMNGPNML